VGPGRGVAYSFMVELTFGGPLNPTSFFYIIIQYNIASYGNSSLPGIVDQAGVKNHLSLQRRYKMMRELRHGHRQGKAGDLMLVLKFTVSPQHYGKESCARWPIALTIKSQEN